MWRGEFEVELTGTNGFFFDFLWVSVHGGGGYVVAVVVWVWAFDLWEWVLGRGVAVPWLWLGIDLAWGRGYGDNAGGGVEISFRWVLMGVLNGFFFDFLWVSLHGGGGCVVAVVVSLVVVAKVGFMVADVGFICLDFCRGVVAWPWVSVWVCSLW